MIRENSRGDSGWSGSAVNNGKKELDSYKAVHERTAPRPGFKMWCGAVANIFYWSDLNRVVYDPTPDDSEEEALSLLFQKSIVVLRGYQLGRTLDDFQNHRVDVGAPFLAGGDSPSRKGGGRYHRNPDRYSVHDEGASQEAIRSPALRRDGRLCLPNPPGFNALGGMPISPAYQKPVWKGEA